MLARCDARPAKQHCQSKVWLDSGAAGTATMRGARELLSANAAFIAAPKSPPPALLWTTEPLALLSAKSSEIAALAAAAAEAATSFAKSLAITSALELALALALVPADVFRRTLRRGAAVAPEDEAEEAEEVAASSSSSFSSSPSPALFWPPLPELSLCVKPSWAPVRRFDLAWPLLPPRPLPALALAALFPLAEPPCTFSMCTLTISARGAEKWQVPGASVQRCAFESECVRACRSMPCSLSKPRPHCVHANCVDDAADGADEDEEEEDEDDVEGVEAEAPGAGEVSVGKEDGEEEDEFDLSRWDLRLCATA